MSEENPMPKVDAPDEPSWVRTTSDVEPASPLDTAAGAGAPVPASHAARSGRGSGRLRALARPVPMLSLALVASLLLSLFLLIRGPGEESDGGRAELLGVAETYAINLSSYDYAKLDQDFARVLDTATGEFKDQYQVAKESLREAIVKFRGKATGTVLARAVLSFGGGQAQVILFVDQTVTNANTAQPRIDRLRMRMGLEKHSGRWLINKLDLV
jgi:Mce-associated membrane protein